MPPSINTTSKYPCKHQRCVFFLAHAQVGECLEYYRGARHGDHAPEEYAVDGVEIDKFAYTEPYECNSDRKSTRLNSSHQD